MARSRNIKHGFFTNDDLAEVPALGRLLFIGLWTIADREGRLVDRPKRIKVEVLPYDDADADALLSALAAKGFIVRFQVAGENYIQIVNFAKHQMPHHKEVASVIPPPPGVDAITRHPHDVSPETRQEVFDRDGNKCLRCQTTEDLSIDHIVALASGGDNAITNLQTLCKRCNSSKGNTTRDHRKPNVEPTLTQPCANVEASMEPLAPLIPDSGFLIPDSGFLKKTPMSGKPDVSSPERGLLEYLNAKAGRSYRPVKANLGLIRARLHEGASVEDCRRVIDLKVAAWKTDPKMCGYLRPETLFNATKFAGYVGERGPPKAGGDWWLREGFGSAEAARSAAKQREIA